MPRFSLKSKLEQLAFKFKNKIPKDHHYYIGEYHHGTAKCVYIPDTTGRVHGGMIFDGSFDFKRYTSGKGYQKAYGTFVQNVKEGDWIFEQNSESMCQQLSMSFNHGYVEGAVSTVRIEMGIGGNRISELYFTIAGDKMVGSLEGNYDNGEVKGSFDDDGQPDGTWIYNKEINKGHKEVYTERWQHGQYIGSTLNGKEFTKEHQLLVSRVNYLVDEDFHQLLNIVRRGTYSKFKSLS